jgi:toxin YoeB
MRSIEFSSKSIEDLLWWVQTDRKLAVRILKLLRELEREPVSGTGKPEPLKGDLAGMWSRRIDQEHRLVYAVTSPVIRILACRYHYDR